MNSITGGLWNADPVLYQVPPIQLTLEKSEHLVNQNSRIAAFFFSSVQYPNNNGALSPELDHVDWRIIASLEWTQKIQINKEL